LNYRHPQFGHADPAEDVVALRRRLDALASDPFVGFQASQTKSPDLRVGVAALRPLDMWIT